MSSRRIISAMRSILRPACNRSPVRATSSSPLRPKISRHTEGAASRILGQEAQEHRRSRSRPPAFFPAMNCFMRDGAGRPQDVAATSQASAETDASAGALSQSESGAKEPPLRRRAGRRSAAYPVAAQQLDSGDRSRRIGVGQQDYVLSGTIQIGGPYLRIMARLTSTSDGLTLWAERYECDLETLIRRPGPDFARNRRRPAIGLTEGEQAHLVRRGTKSGKAWDLFQRAHDIERQFTREGHEKAKDFYEEALNSIPNYLSALVALAFCHLDEVRLGGARMNEIRSTRPMRSATGQRARRLRNADVSALKAFLVFLPEALGWSARTNAGSRAACPAKPGDHRLSRRAFRPDGRLPLRHRLLHTGFVLERAFAGLDSVQSGSVASRRSATRKRPSTSTAKCWSIIPNMYGPGSASLLRSIGRARKTRRAAPAIACCCSIPHSPPPNG